jgi:hypothetical protein
VSRRRLTLLLSLSSFPHFSLTHLTSIYSPLLPLLSSPSVVDLTLPCLHPSFQYPRSYSSCPNSNQRPPLFLFFPLLFFLLYTYLYTATHIYIVSSKPSPRFRVSYHPQAVPPISFLVNPPHPRDKTRLKSPSPIVHPT